ncbi:tetratricopeptide repeat protein 39C-like [Trichogramma pretiosum]|uniref:tetratricopeptide repeat protein 39C-like n=1 Tax=Trichogramma pretiosum TaxID=7493 RepID=UPI000C71C393|nr:tetratricopeptide repeat protein 39C-like [Trichogramma pretiosum]
MVSTEADWDIARKGIALLLNNQTDEAERLFSQHPRSFQIKAGRCFVLFMNALMTFEEDKVRQAVELLRDMERDCQANDDGWLRSMKNRVFGPADLTAKEYVQRLERQVVLADSQVCAALLTLLQQELSGYVRAGWMLRKAWRIYQSTYNQILQLHRRTFGTCPSGFASLRGSISGSGNPPSQLTSPSSPNQPDWSPASSYNGSARSSLNDGGPGPYVTPTSPFETPSSGLRSSLSMLFSFAGISSEQPTPFVEPTEVTRLMTAVSFGYGVFQLFVSLMPPTMLKYIHLLGFEGDRQAGLTALMYSRSSQDMRAPLATLALLWFHTIVRPFFGLDGANVEAGVEAAKELLIESQPEFGDSAVFLFFHGRIERLQSNVNGALRAYQRAVQLSSQREVKLLCLHEVAWCHLIHLNYEEAHGSLTKLQEDSRWSKSFYAYLAAVSSGSDGHFDRVISINRKLIFLLTGTARESQIGIFIARRAPKLINPDNGEVYTVPHYRMLVYELLYLWNAMPSCSKESLRVIVFDCRNSRSEEPMTGLADLLEGAAYAFLGDQDASVRCYRNCLARRTPSKDVIDQHISAFALYELGSALCDMKNYEEGRFCFHKALTMYKNYDFDGRLSVRIHSALKKVLTIDFTLKIYQNGCSFEPGNCVVQDHSCRKGSWFCKFLKPLFSFVVSVALVLSISHVCEKYSSNNSFREIKADLSSLRNNLNILSDDVKTLMEAKELHTSKWKDVACKVPKITEAISNLRTELTEEAERLQELSSPDNIKKITNQQLEIYNADKTGQADYALETSGGAIISIRKTETYTGGAVAWKLLGMPICKQDNNPRSIIQKGVLPGECWAIRGNTGEVVIQLMGSVRVSGFSLEHISPAISPTGENSSAPKEFSIWGLDDEHDKNPFMFGKYTYDIKGPAVQFFSIQKDPKRAYEFVELKIHSNGGNSKYTCIYRIRVHGILESYQEIRV